MRRLTFAATQSIYLSEAPALQIMAPLDVVTNCGPSSAPAGRPSRAVARARWPTGWSCATPTRALSGTNLDAGPLGNHGAALGGASLTTGKASFGTALLLDGVNDHVRVPRNSDFVFTNFTLATWLRTSASSTGRRRLISQQDATTNGYWLIPSIITASSSARTRTTSSPTPGRP